MKFYQKHILSLVTALGCSSILLTYVHAQVPATAELPASIANDAATCSIRVIAPQTRRGASSTFRSPAPFILRLENGIYKAYRHVEGGSYELIPLTSNNLRLRESHINRHQVRFIESNHPEYRDPHSSMLYADVARVSPTDNNVIQVLNVNNAPHHRLQFSDEIRFQGSCPRDILRLVQQYPFIAGIMYNPDTSGLASSHKIRDQINENTPSAARPAVRVPATPRTNDSLERFREAGHYHRSGSFKPDASSVHGQPAE